MNLLKTKTLPLFLSVFILAPSNSHAGPEDDPELLYQVAVTAVVLVVGVVGALYCLCTTRSATRTSHEEQGSERRDTFVFDSAGGSGGVIVRTSFTTGPMRIEDRGSSDDEGDVPLETTPEVSAALLQHLAGLREVVKALAGVAYELKLDPRNTDELEALVQRILTFDILNEPIEVLEARLVELTKFIVPMLEVAPLGELQKRLLDAARALAVALSKLAPLVGKDESGFRNAALALKAKVKESRLKARDLQRDKERTQREEDAQRKQALEEELAKQRQAVARRQHLQEVAARDQERAARTRQYDEEFARQARELARQNRVEEERARQQQEAAQRQRAEEERQRQIQEARVRETAQARQREEERRGVVPMRVGYGVTLEDLQAEKAKREKK